MEPSTATAARETPARHAAASSTPLGLWRYRDLLPQADAVTLGEGWTPLLRSRRHPGLHLKDESRNPTGTSDARGFALAATLARRQGSRILAGTSAALAPYAAAAGLTAHLYLPHDVPAAQYVDATACGATVHLIEGTAADCARALATVTENWLDLSDPAHPFRLAGDKTLGYELCEQLDWQYPAAIFHSVGGDLALTQAFDDLEQLDWITPGTTRPRLYPVPSPAADETLITLREYANHEGLILSFEGAAAAAAHTHLLTTGELHPTDLAVVINPGTALYQTTQLATLLNLRPTALLPRSMPVGGIITPV